MTLEGLAVDVSPVVTKEIPLLPASVCCERPLFSSTNDAAFISLLLALKLYIYRYIPREKSTVYLVEVGNQTSLPKVTYVKYLLTCKYSRYLRYFKGTYSTVRTLRLEPIGTVYTVH